MGMGGLISSQILSLLWSWKQPTVCLWLALGFLKLDNMSCQMNHILYIVLNFEVLKPYSEKNFWQEKLAYIGSNQWIVFTFPLREGKNLKLFKHK